ncbi:MAG: hypothetical protein GDA35_00140 [Hyphomonadaceae bacterium]|nr:hypothetical protein [Hyphomonadaceae bacterium]
MDKTTLLLVGEWARTRVASEEESPWTFHKLRKFADLAEELAAGMEPYPDRVCADSIQYGDAMPEQTDVTQANKKPGPPPDAPRASGGGPAAKIVRLDNFR